MSSNLDHSSLECNAHRTDPNNASSDLSSNNINVPVLKWTSKIFPHHDKQRTISYLHIEISRINIVTVEICTKKVLTILLTYAGTLFTLFLVFYAKKMFCPEINLFSGL